MPSRSRARRSSRSSLKNSFKSASILEQGGQPALRDKVPSTSNTGAQDEIEPATFTSQPEFPRLSRPLGPQSPSAGAVTSAAINTVAGTALEFAQSEASTIKPDFIHEHSGQHPSQDEDIMPSTTTEDEIVAVPRTPQPGSTHLPHPFLPGSWAAGGAASAHTATAGPAADNPAESPTRGESAGIRIHPMASGQRDPLPHTQFGLPTDQFRGQYPQGGPRMDYKQKYPEDPTYKETEENARVFHVYNDESQIFDNDMILEAGDSLDILLVFAGLFASVLTTFVAQTSQSLSPDKTEISNSLLREMISLQRAQENGTSFTSIPTADTSFVASRSDIWVNSLWFVSLALSLSTALLAVIAKQWLRQYSSFISGTPRERALIRQFRYDSLEKWGVRLIIGLLPTILHVSLFLFMGGLVVFLLPLNNTLARVVASVTGFICAAYAIMNVLPVIFPQCPYRTPLSEILNSIYGFVVFIPVFLRALLVMVPCILVIFPWILVASLLEHVRVVDDGNDWIPDWLEALVLKPEWITFTVSWPDPLREVERQRANKADSWGRPLGISGTLMWLAQNTSDISAKAIVAEAVGSVCHPSFTPSEGTIFDNAIKQQLSVISQWGIRDGQLLGAGDERIIERLMRSAFLVGYDIPSDELPTDVEANSTLLAFAGTYYCTARFHAGGEVKVLKTHLIFSLVLEQYEMLEVFEAPTWIWWIMCKHAIFDKHFHYYLGEINYFCTKGIIDIGSPGEFLNLLHISPMLRHTVREHMIEIYSTRKSRQLQRPISPDTLSALSEFYVTREFEKNLLSPFSTVSLVNFFIYNFAQCTDFWMGSGEVE